MTSLKDIVIRIKERQAEAAVDIEQVNPKTRVGVEGMIRTAKRELVELEREYVAAVLKSVKILAVNGDKQEDLVKMARDAGILIVDFDQPAKELINAIGVRSILKDGTVGYSSELNFIFMDELNRFRVKYEINMMAPPVKQDNVALQGKPFQEAIRNILEVNYGDSLRSAVARVEITRQAFDKKISLDVVPVVIYNFEGGMDNTYLQNPVTAVTINEDATAKQIQEIAVAFAQSLVPKQTEKAKLPNKKEKQV